MHSTTMFLVAASLVGSGVAIRVTSDEQQRRLQQKLQHQPFQFQPEPALPPIPQATQHQQQHGARVFSPRTVSQVPQLPPLSPTALSPSMLSPMSLDEISFRTRSPVSNQASKTLNSVEERDVSNLSSNMSQTVSRQIDPKTRYSASRTDASLESSSGGTMSSNLTRNDQSRVVSAQADSSVTDGTQVREAVVEESDLGSSRGDSESIVTDIRANTQSEAPRSDLSVSQQTSIVAENIVSNSEASRSDLNFSQQTVTEGIVSNGPASIDTPASDKTRTDDGLSDAVSNASSDIAKDNDIEVPDTESIIGLKKRANCIREGEKVVEEVQKAAGVALGARNQVRDEMKQQALCMAPKKGRGVSIIETMRNLDLESTSGSSGSN